MINWKSEKRKIAVLKPAEYNPRKATEQQFNDLKKSIEKFDLADPLIINKDNTVIGGHFRLKVLKGNGVKEVDVRVPDKLLNKEMERELNLRLNKNLGEWDFDLLVNFDEGMLRSVGFTDLDLKILEPSENNESEEILVSKKNECPKCGHKW